MLDLKGNKTYYFGHRLFWDTTPSGQFALIDPGVNTNPKCPGNLKKLRAGRHLSHPCAQRYMGDLLGAGQTIQTQDRR